MRKFSQVFLTNESAAIRIAEAACGIAADHLVEIGPGRGALTSHLYALRLCPLTLVEIDRDLAPKLSPRYPEARVINADFLRVDLEKEFPSGRVAFAGNLPYDCATPILDRVLSFPRFAGAVLMFQKEVVDKALAAPGDSAYGYLSVMTAVRSSARRLMDLGPGSFSPQPKVDSSVVIFSPLTEPFLPQGMEAIFVRAVKAAFMHRRKTVLNSLSAAGDTMLHGVPRIAAAAALEKAGIAPTLRAQALSPADFLRLAGALRGRGR
ncbi:MAG: 16S rRNA (adenine1518-N6/adenine1519-N6)-dimethyltransferase [Elusimicrobia bacterium]|nr:MAG: 16S rRNA (adenine1518-N6/adenine1519-N6)-dimethyltransferase [Elusimicrobiota bacterium]KAF0155621.1 MAG: 16S rRNA (adenine1518-N6/adenine1519-N6)-dimethyltransferase [Elusimicrobiota bacterium]